MGLMQDALSERSRLLKTLCLTLCTLMHGLHTGSSGPALADLSQQVQASVSRTGLIFTLESAGFFTGSLACLRLLSVSFT